MGWGELWEQAQDIPGLRRILPRPDQFEKMDDAGWERSMAALERFEAILDARRTMSSYATETATAVHRSASNILADPWLDRTRGARSSAADSPGKNARPRCSASKGFGDLPLDDDDECGGNSDVKDT